MTDLSKLTAKDFSDAMHKGWEGLRFAKFYFISKARNHNFTPRNAIACCAVGAMAKHLKANPHDVQIAVNKTYKDGLSIVYVSDRAGNKRAAMKAVDAILLGAKP